MQRGFSRLKPLDATHTATAAIANVEEMHTFDDAVLSLDGLINKDDGTPLKICKPDPGGPPAPLLDAMNAGAPNAPPNQGPEGQVEAEAGE